MGGVQEWRGAIPIFKINAIGDKIDLILKISL